MNNPSVRCLVDHLYTPAACLTGWCHR